MYDPKGVIENVLVHIHNFHFPIDFIVILHMSLMHVCRCWLSSNIHFYQQLM